MLEFLPYKVLCAQAAVRGRQERGQDVTYYVRKGESSSPCVSLFSAHITGHGENERMERNTRQKGRVRDGINADVR